MNINQIRNSIRNRAKELGCTYRITAGGEVHYYGRMPNSTANGWYFVGWDAEAVAREIEQGQR